MNVCVLIDELDETMEAIKAASGAINDAFSHWIAIFNFLHLFVHDFENQTNNPDHSQEECTKSEGALIVLKTPDETLTQTKATPGILSRCEIPSACSYNDGILEQSLNKFHNPKVHEDLNPHKLFLHLRQFDVLILTTGSWLCYLRSTNKHYEQRYPTGCPHYNKS